MPGSALSGLGHDVRQFAIEEQNKLDELRVEDAAAKLRQQELELTLGKNGYQNVKGGDVLARPLTDDYTSQYKAAAAGIAASLSPAQKARFDLAARRGLVNFQAGVMQHSMSEAERYDGEVFKAGIAAETDAAAKQADNPMAVAQSLNNVDGLVANRVRRLGITDPKMLDQLVKETRGSVHAAAVEGLIAADNLTGANEYLKHAKADMTHDQAKALENKLKPLTDDALGTDIAMEAFKKIKEGKPMIEVATWLAESTKGNPRTNNSASVELNRLQAADKADDEQSRGQYMLRYMQTPNAATASAVRKDVVRDNSLDDGQKATVLKHLDDLQQQQQSRAREDIRWARYNQAYAEEQKGNKLDSFVRFGQLLDDPETYQKSDEQLASYAKEIGIANTRTLMSAVKATKAQAARFDIDKTLVDEAAKSATSAKDQQLAYKAIVETTKQEWLLANPGRTPNKQEQDAILRSGLMKWRDFKGFDGTVPAYKAAAGRSVPQWFYEQANAILAPQGKADSEEDIVKMWTDYQTEKQNRLRKGTR